MKKYFTIFGLFLLTVSVSAQTGHTVPAKQSRSGIFTRLFESHRGVATHPAFFTRIHTLKNGVVVKQKIDSLLLKGYNNVGDTTMVNISKGVFGYDADGNDTLYVIYSWDDNTWVGEDKSVYSYTNGNKTKVIYYEWNDDANDWEIDGIEKSYYNQAGQDTLDEEYYNEIDDQWVVSSIVKYFYDAEGRDTLIMTYSSDTVGGSMTIATYKIKCYYNSAGKDSLIIAYNKSGDDEWAYDSKKEYVYNKFGKLAQETFYDWDTSNSAWVPNELDEYTYDDSGNLVSYVYNDWDKITHSWLPDEKDVVFYNTSYPSSDLLLPQFQSDEDISILFEYMINKLDIYEWEEDSAKWMYGSTISFYYSPQDISGIEPHKASLNVQIYPNPADDYVMVNVKNGPATGKMDLFDLLGKKVYSVQFTNHSRISLPGLKSGIYICRIVSQGRSYVTKLKIK